MSMAHLNQMHFSTRTAMLSALMKSLPVTQQLFSQNMKGIGLSRTLCLLSWLQWPLWAEDGFIRFYSTPASSIAIPPHNARSFSNRTIHRHQPRQRRSNFRFGGTIELLISRLPMASLKISAAGKMN